MNEVIFITTLVHLHWIRVHITQLQHKLRLKQTLTFNSHKYLNNDHLRFRKTCSTHVIKYYISKFQNLTCLAQCTHVVLRTPRSWAATTLRAAFQLISDSVRENFAFAFRVSSKNLQIKASRTKSLTRIRFLTLNMKNVK